jgi:transcriptional regulator with XRE-family HTH domain
MICVIIRYFETKRRIIMSNGFGSRLKEIRQRLKMTQQQLGKILGINASAVAKYENEVTFPNVKMLNILASKYNICMDYLLCGRGTLFYEDKDAPDSSQFQNIISGDKEMEELFSLVSSISWVRYAVLSYFQRFKLEHRHLMEKELEKDIGASLHPLSPTGS